MPRITPFYFEDNPVHSGQFVHVACTVSEGDLPVKFRWFLNEQLLGEFSDVTISQFGKRTSMLAVESVMYSHAGNYTCRANNDAGETFFTTELQVNGYFKL